MTEYAASDGEGPLSFELEQLSTTVAEIYDAALDPTRWQRALKLVTEYVGGVQGSIFWHDSAASAASVLHIVDELPEFTRRYLEHYVKLNPLFPASTFFEPGEVYAATDVVPYDEFVQTRFYKEWVKPQGILDAVAANLERSATASAMIAVRLREEHSPASAESKQRLALLVPHIRRAIAIGHLVEQHAEKSRALTTTLDMMSAGVLLVDQRGRIVHSNAAGEDMLTRQSLVRMVRGNLLAIGADANRELQDALGKAAAGDAALGLRGVEIRLPALPDQRWLAHVLPLTGGARRAHGNEHEASAAVFVRRAALDTPSALATMARLYKLTGSEVKTLQAIVQTGGVSQVAAETGVSEATVKTHLQHLFAKTSTRRQVELVRLVAEHAGGESLFSPSR